MEADFSWMAWDWHPDIFFGLLLLQTAYMLGVGPLRKRYGWADSVDSRHVFQFTAGIVLLFLALHSPLHDLADNYLFTAHMVQHMLMILAAAPLLIMGTPGWLLRPLLSPPLVAKVASVLTRPLVAFLVFNGSLAFWHLEPLFDSALNNHGVHVVEHLSFIFTGLIVWWPILSPMHEFPRLNYPGQMLYLFLLSFLPAVLGAFITFTKGIMYPLYAEAPRVYDISPILDQQMAGLLMKTLGAVVYIAILIVIFFKWYSEEEEKDRTESASGELVS